MEIMQDKKTKLAIIHLSLIGALIFLTIIAIILMVFVFDKSEDHTGIIIFSVSMLLCSASPIMGIIQSVSCRKEQITNKLSGKVYMILNLVLSTLAILGLVVFSYEILRANLDWDVPMPNAVLILAFVFIIASALLNIIVSSIVIARARKDKNRA